MQFQARVDAGRYMARIEVSCYRRERKWCPGMRAETWIGRIGGKHVAIDVNATPTCLDIYIRARKWHHWGWRWKDTKAALLAWWDENMAVPEQPAEWWRR